MKETESTKKEQKVKEKVVQEEKAGCTAGSGKNVEEKEVKAEPAEAGKKKKKEKRND